MSSSNERPTLVVFDLDDTLYPYEKPNAAGEAALIKLGSLETGISQKDFGAAITQSRVKVKKRLGETGSSHSRLLYIHEALNKMGFANQPSLALSLEQEYWREYLMEMELRTGAESLLLKLRYNQIPIALVTDLTLQIQLRKIVHLGLESFFDIVVASEETHRDKPSLDPFFTLQERSMDGWMENVWFIGDKPHDAPVKELCSSKLIQSGHGYLFNRTNSREITGWMSLEEVEKHFSRIIDNHSQ